MSYVYYPGCSVKGMNKPYDIATRAIAKKLGIELHELEDWNCCGATAYFSIREIEAFILSARNLALAEKLGEDLVTVCSACYCTLGKTNEYIKTSRFIKKVVTSALTEAGLKFEGNLRVRHLLDVLVNDVGEQKIRNQVLQPLTGLKVVPYYGCQIVRPLKGFDDPEYPTSMDCLLTWLDAQAVHYQLKTFCCGGMMMYTNENIGLGMTKDLLQCAVENGGECITTVCPLCQMNLESYQGRINKKFNTEFSIPVLSLPQIIGLAFGLSKKEIGIGTEIVPLGKSIMRFVVRQ